MPEKIWFICFAQKTHVTSTKIDYVVEKCRHPFEFALRNAVALIHWKELTQEEAAIWDWCSNGIALEDVVPAMA